MDLTPLVGSVGDFLDSLAMAQLGIALGFVAISAVFYGIGCVVKFIDGKG